MFVSLSCCLKDKVCFDMPALLLAEDSPVFACNRLYASIEVVTRRIKPTSDMFKRANTDSTGNFAICTGDARDR